LFLIEQQFTEQKIKFYGGIIDNLHSIQDVYKYNLYMLAEVYLHNKSGVFTTDDLIVVLRDKLGQKSLKSKTNIYKKRKELNKILVNAPLFFKYLGGNRFKIISNRKILNNLGSSKLKTPYFYFPLNIKSDSKDFILNRKTFLDYCISFYLLHHNGFSNPQVAKHFNITVKRVQNATKSNNEKENVNERIIKRFRFAKTSCADEKEAKELRKQLWEEDGICSIILKNGCSFYLAVFRTNFYDGNNIPSHKSRVKTSAEKVISKGNFQPVKRYRKKSEFFKDCNLEESIFKDSLQYFFMSHPETEKELSDFNTWNLGMYVSKYGKCNA